MKAVPIVRMDKIKNGIPPAMAIEAYNMVAHSQILGIIIFISHL
jgi:hypothetical protein